MSDQTSTDLREQVRSGFTDVSVTFAAEAAPGMHSASIRAVKPVTA